MQKDVLASLHCASVSTLWDPYDLSLDGWSRNRHDRLTHISLCAQLGQEPILYDWEFLLPSEISDVELEQGIQSSNASLGTHIPIISGFIALIKVFLSVGQLISIRKPLSFTHPNPSWTTNILDQLCLNPSYIPHGPAKECLDIDSLRQMLRNLANVLNDLPPELQITDNDPDRPSSSSIQYDIMKANIHITRIFFQSKILERCSTVFYDSSVRRHLLVWLHATTPSRSKPLQATQSHTAVILYPHNFSL